ncbi:sensor domain-containing protein [Mycobacterium kansasii]|uniref:sensor domain-containing protein n=1 Tax=Mycobacterium kansasii TaxID=1768 RepID=UPI0009B85025|nr:sensor domain-containing protein [Mycobacterium kansasii]
MSAVSLTHHAGPISGAPTPDTGARTARLAPAVRWALLVGTAATALLTGCTATTTGHPAAAPDLGRWQPPAILPQHLGDLLLKESDVNTIGHTSAMAVRAPVARMWNDEDIVSDPNCLATYSPAEATAYQGSNWNAVQGQILDDAAPVRPEHVLAQVLVGFRDADSAQQFFSQAKTRWSGCANRSITVTPPGRAPVTWNFGAPQATDTTLATTQNQVNGRGLICQRAMGLANNVIIDTLWCGFDTSSQASDIVSKTAASIVNA